MFDKGIVKLPLKIGSSLITSILRIWLPSQPIIAHSLRRMEKVFYSYAKLSSGILCINVRSRIPLLPKIALLRLRILPFKIDIYRETLQRTEWGYFHSSCKLTSLSRTVPNKFVDAKVLSPDLAGIMMVSADSTVDHPSTSGLILEYDEVDWHFAQLTCVVHCI
jgi:hypothetical protein